MGKKKEHDFNIVAFNVVQQATSEDEPVQDSAEIELVDGKNPAAVTLGRLGGLKGGKARAQKLSPERRREIAQKAAQKRWQKKSQ